MNSIAESAPRPRYFMNASAAAAAAALSALAPGGASAQAGPAAPPPPAQSIRVVADAGGLRLQVEGRDFMVYGMNWDYVPIGQNYSYSLWTQPDDVIEAALGREMPLLKRMGVNAIRVYVGIPARWIKYIYQRWGIYTVLNHTVGRYGYTLDGVWIPSVDYSSPKLRAALKAEVLAMVDEFRNVPGVLMWLLGNENNYGLSWSSSEIENLPKGERDTARARFLYGLFGEVIREIKARDSQHPVAIANGDLQYLDLIAEECKGLDVLGSNVYRGMSAGDLFQRVHDKLGVPVMFTEFGADAYDAKQMREDDVTQAKYLLSQWREIYEQSAGKGQAGNAIGGFIFQWADGWWKFNQETHLDIHDTNASWSNGAYKEDYVEGQNNMNEEWWGICAKGQPDSRGLFELYPRTAYYALQEAFRLQPYAASTDSSAIKSWFGSVDAVAFSSRYRADRAANTVAQLAMVRVSNLRLSFESYGTGGYRLSTPSSAPTVPTATLPAYTGFDHTESMYADVEVRPADNVVGTLSLNVLGNVAQNPIDGIYYENRVLNKASKFFDCTSGTCKELVQIRRELGERVKIYNSTVSWDDTYFKLDGFYRTGHYHWGYEGDFFGLYREANYGINIDTYNADTPLGVEVAFKKELDGLKIAFGPQLWWGANPAVMGKYRRSFGAFDFAVIHEEQVAGQAAVTTSAAVPEKQTRKSTLYGATQLGIFRLELGLIWAGSTLVGDCDSRVVGQSTAPCFKTQVGTVTRLDHVRWADTFGGKAKLTAERGLWHWYAQAAYMGLVADGGPTSTITFTGWSLKDSGSGNQVNALTGLAVNVGPFQFGPNFLWQKPLVGPGPGFVDPVRNILHDPFSVRGNREMIAGELMLVFDPTPGTWMWTWDNDLREDAPFAASLDFTFRHQPACSPVTAADPAPVCISQDAAIGVLADGTRFPFPGSPPRRNLWETQLRVVSAPRNDLRLVAHGFVGNGEPNGNDAREVHRYGGDFRLTWKRLVLSGFAKFNDWGLYDFHRDFNLTFPVQLMGDVGITLGAPRWLWLQQTRLGLRATKRWLNAFSPRFVPDPADPRGWGSEYELRTYLVVTL